MIRIFEEIKKILSMKNKLKLSQKKILLNFTIYYLILNQVFFKKVKIQKKIRIPYLGLKKVEILQSLNYNIKILIVILYLGVDNNDNNIKEEIFLKNEGNQMKNKGT